MTDQNSTPAREAFKAAMVTAAAHQGGAGAQFIAKGHSNLWLDIAYAAAEAMAAATHIGPQDDGTRREAMAEAIWNANPHRGNQPWDSIGMRRYNGTSDVREMFLGFADAALALPAPSDQDASQAHGEVERRARALSQQLHAVIFRLNGQAYSSTRSALNYLDAALSPAPGATAQDGVERCAECDRHILTENRAGTGFIAECGNRLASIDECRASGCATPTPTIPAGMVAWNGGDSAPDDIGEASEVMHADGSIGLANKRSILWGRPEPKPMQSFTPGDYHSKGSIRDSWIIAYTPLAAAPKQAEQQGVEIIARELWSILFGAVDFEQASDEWRGTIFDHAHRILAALNAPTGAVEKGK